MQVVLTAGCDRAWRERLSPWQEHVLACLYRQGRGLRDGTDHGLDMRWQQAGVKIRESNWGTVKRNSRKRGHERVVIVATDYGYNIELIRRQYGFHVNPDTGEFIESPAVWVSVGRWYVTAGAKANYPPPHSRTSADALAAVRADQ